MKSLFEGLIICVWHLYLILLQNLPVNIFSYSTTKSSHRNLCVRMKTRKFLCMLKSFFYYTFCSRFQVCLSFHENKKAGKRNSVECDFCPTIHVVSFSLKQWNNVTWIFFRLWPLIEVSLKAGANQSNISSNIFSACWMKCWMKNYVFHRIFWFAHVHPTFHQPFERSLIHKLKFKINWKWRKKFGYHQY